MINEQITEVIFVGLPGPTHHYGGLSGDNVASSKHRGSVSHPRQAAQQALALVRLLKKLGLHVGILPPQLRPHLNTLRGQFAGEAEDIIHRAAKEAPALLEAASSSAAMWTANAATVAPGIDCTDGKLHITVANLHTNLHRRIEAFDTYRVLDAIFKKVSGAVVHPPMPASDGYLDEGAANHMRLAPRHGAPALNVYVYGGEGLPGDPPSARQNLLASQAIAQEQQIRAPLFIKQNAEAIRSGVFHNDVIAVANESLLMAHELAYENGRNDIERIESAYQTQHGQALSTILFGAEELSFDEAVATYLFNSQIVTTAHGMEIIAPLDIRSQLGGKVEKLLQKKCAGTPVRDVHLIDLKQSMQNGGGPACLRLRVPMTVIQLAALQNNVNVMATDALLQKLEWMIEAHYPGTLHPYDLGSPELYHNCQRVIAEMGEEMRLPLL